MSTDLLGGASDDEGGDPRMALVAEHQQVRADLVSELDDGCGCVTHPDLVTHGGPVLLDDRSRLYADVLVVAVLLPLEFVDLADGPGVPWQSLLDGERNETRVEAACQLRSLGERCVAAC